MKSVRHAICAALFIASTGAFAWNDCTHMAMAEIAYQRLKDDPAWPKIVELLKSHPFAAMFVEKMPADLSEEAQQHYLFLLAATWPDKVRKTVAGALEKEVPPDELKRLREAAHPNWEWVNFPLERGVKGKHPSTDRWKKGMAEDQMSILQALDYAEEVLRGTANTDAQGAVLPKSVALTWMLHLIGDLHQPLHTTALFSNEFKDGDKGGNLFTLKSFAPLTIPLAPGKSPNLHALWDWIVCPKEDPSVTDAVGVAAEVLKLKLPESVDVGGGGADWVRTWARETHGIAGKLPGNKDAAAAEGDIYTNLLDAEGALKAAYIEVARTRAQEQVLKAGLRLAAKLKELVR